MNSRALITSLAATAALSGAGVAMPAAAMARPASHHNKTVAHHKARTFSFYARVVRSGPAGLMVRLRNGKSHFFSARQLSHKRRAPVRKGGARRHHRHALKTHGVLAHAADATTPPVSVNIVGLQPGVTVLVTETVNPDGSVTITITLPPAGTLGEQTATGEVGDVNDDTFDVLSTDGSELRLHMAADALSALNLTSCQTVNLTYHQDTALLIADTVTVTGSSTSDDCQPTTDVVGTITAVSRSELTISSDQGSMSFSVDDSDITDGFVVGDQVDVTYVQNSDGSLNAQDVEYDEQDASGAVTAVSSTSMTMTDDSTGNSETFVTDPSNGIELDGSGFDGVQVGDSVDVIYHVSGGKLVAEDVSDNGSDDSSSSDDSSDGSSSDGSSSGDDSSGD